MEEDNDSLSTSASKPKRQVRPLPTEAFTSISLFRRAIAGPFREDMSRLQLTWFIDNPTRSVRDIMTDHGFSGPEPPEPTPPADYSTMERNVENATLWSAEYAIYEKKQAEKRKWHTARAKAIFLAKKEEGEATDFSTHLLAAFPNSATAQDIKRTLHQLVQDPGSPDISMKRPSVILSTIESLLIQGASKSTHAVKHWLTEFTGHKTLDTEKGISSRDLQSFLEAINRLDTDYQIAFNGVPCAKAISCEAHLRDCGCDWSKRVLNHSLILLSHFIGERIDTLVPNSRYHKLHEARNTYCLKTPEELNRSDLSKFIVKISDLKADLTRKSEQSTAATNTPSTKSANLISEEDSKKKKNSTDHVKLDLPKSRADWISRKCLIPKHAHFDHPAAECRSLLHEASQRKLLEDLNISDFFDWHVKKKNSKPPPSGWSPNSGSKSKRSNPDFDSDPPSDNSTSRPVKKKARFISSPSTTQDPPLEDSDDDSDSSESYFSFIQPDKEPEKLAMHISDNHNSSRRIIIDTGCRHTTLRRSNLLDSEEPYSGQDPYVVAAGGNKLPIALTGTMNLSILDGEPPRIHRDCLVVPSCREDLFSLTHFMVENPDLCCLISSKGAFITKLKEVQKILETATRLGWLKNGSYLLDPRVLSSTKKGVFSASKKVSRPGSRKAAVYLPTTNSNPSFTSDHLTDTWYKHHRRFGHLDTKKWESLLEKGEVNKALFRNLNPDCVICAIGKLRYVKPKSTERPATHAMQRVHSDSFPLSSNDISRTHYCTLMVEEYTRYKTCFFTRTKDETAIGKGVIQILKQWSVKMGQNVQELRTDGGREFDNPSVREYLASVGAVHKKSPAYTQALNGLAESNIGKLKDSARCMLLDANISIEFASYALRHATAISNLTTHPYTNSIPYSSWHRRKPNLDSLLPFGCLVAVYEPKETRNINGEKGTLGIYLGLESTDLYRIFTFSTQRITHEKLIQPFESRFPGLRRVGLLFKPIIDPHCYEIRVPSAIQVENDRQLLIKSWDDAEAAELQGEPTSSTASHIPSTDRNTAVPASDFFAPPDFSLRGRVGTNDAAPAIVNNDKSRMETESTTAHATQLDEERSSECVTSPQRTSDSSTTELSAHTRLEEGQPSLQTVSSDDLTAEENATVSNDVDMSTSDDYNEDIVNNEENLEPVDTFVPDLEIRELRGGRWRAVDIARLLHTSMTPIPDKYSHVYRVTGKRPNPLAGLDLRTYKGPGVKPPNDIKILEAQPAPQSFHHVAYHDFKDHWISAMQNEMSSLKDKNTFLECKLPAGRKPVGLVWKYKYKSKGELVDKFKARLCVLGNTQTPGVDYDPENIFAPVMRGSTMRTALALLGPDGPRKMWITQADYTLAFLNASPKEKVYVKPPPGFPLKDSDNVLLLLRSLYGLCQSPREWYEYLRDWLKSQSFIESKADPCLFTRRGEDGVLQIILVYVDDTLIFASSKALANQIKDLMRSKFEMTDVEDADKVIGVEIFRVEGGLCLGQPTYAKMTLQEAGFWDVHNEKLPENPISENWTHDDNSLPLTGSERDFFVSYLMKLAWMSQQTRIDLAASASILAQYLSKPTKSDLAALKRCLLYLRGSWDDVLFYQDDMAGELIFDTDLQPFHNSDDSGLLFAYADASFANEEGRKSRSGSVVMLRGAAIDWSSKKQSMVALSSTEAEYYSVSQVTQSALHFRNVLCDLDVELKKPIRIYEDNKSCIAIAYKPKHHGRTKHFDVKAHFIRDHVDKGDVEIIYCPTELQVADMLTKSLPPVLHRRLKRFAGMVPLSTLKVKKLNQE